MPLIYILEDDNSVRELESYALQCNGYEVRGFDNPKSFYEEQMCIRDRFSVVSDVDSKVESGTTVMPFSITMQSDAELSPAVLRKSPEFLFP